MNPGLLTVVLCSSLLLTARGQNLIDAQYGAGAGSFELGSFVPNQDDTDMILPVGSTFLTGWSIGGPGDGVDWIQGTSSKFIDLSHSSASSIFTSLSTVPGYEYNLSFDYFNYRGGGNQTVWVFTDSTLLINADTACCGFVWRPERNFVATSDETLLTFRAIGPWANGPALDNVVVQLVAIPEPSVISLAALGAVALGVVRYRRRTRS